MNTSGHCYYPTIFVSLAAVVAATTRSHQHNVKAMGQVEATQRRADLTITWSNLQNLPAYRSRKSSVRSLKRDPDS